MAISAVNVTYTITETITIDGKTEDVTNTHTESSSATEIYKRITDVTSSFTELLQFGGDSSQILAAGLKYLRITNLEEGGGDNFVLNLKDASSESSVAALKIRPGHSFVLTDASLIVHDSDNSDISPTGPNVMTGIRIRHDDASGGAATRSCEVLAILA